LKVIFDTNVYIATLIKPSGTAAKAYTLWSKDKRFSLLTSETQLDEFRRVSRYPELKALISSQRAGAMVNKLRLRATLIAKTEAITVAKDPDDDFLLAMVLAAKADYLVSLDQKHVLSLGKIGETPMVSLAEFLTLFD
jgi:uncharacterized protein